MLRTMATSLLFLLSDDNPLCKEDDNDWVKSPQDVIQDDLKMLLTSRTRCSNLEHVPLINGTILNYGISDSIGKSSDKSTVCINLTVHLKEIISRFEPRMSNVKVNGYIDHLNIIRFSISCCFCNAPIVLKLAWDDCIGKFSFYE